MNMKNEIKNSPYIKLKNSNIFFKRIAKDLNYIQIDKKKDFHFNSPSPL